MKSSPLKDNQEYHELVTSESSADVRSFLFFFVCGFSFSRSQPGFRDWSLANFTSPLPHSPTIHPQNTKEKKSRTTKTKTRTTKTTKRKQKKTTTTRKKKYTKTNRTKRKKNNTKKTTTTKTKTRTMKKITRKTRRRRREERRKRRREGRLRGRTRGRRGGGGGGIRKRGRIRSRGRTFFTQFAETLCCLCYFSWSSLQLSLKPLCEINHSDDSP